MDNTLTLNLPFPIVKHVGLKFSLKTLWLAILILIACLLVVLNIVQISKMTEELYLIKNYEQQLAGLSLESKILESNFLEYNSLNNIEGLVKMPDFEPVAEISYIQFLDSVVVSN